MKGNARGSGYDRQRHDWYRESAAAVDALLDAERPFRGIVWDPAAGGGNIPSRVIARGGRCRASDIMDRGYRPTMVSNFLGMSPPNGWADSMITNPPYQLAVKFLLHALPIATDRVALLVRLAFLEGQARRKIFEQTPLARVWVFSSRQSMPPGDVAAEAKGGAVAYAWLVWDKLDPPAKPGRWEGGFLL